jgi:hypothetical protein
LNSLKHGISFDSNLDNSTSKILLKERNDRKEKQGSDIDLLPLLKQKVQEDMLFESTGDTREGKRDGNANEEGTKNAKEEKKKLGNTFYKFQNFDI